MKILRVEEMGRAAILKLLQKPPFDQITLSAAIRKRNHELFGEDLTAEALVQRIVNDVRTEGDKALTLYTEMFDGALLKPADFLVPEEAFQKAEQEADPAVVASLQKAVVNIRRYHQEQKQNSWFTYRPQGAMLGQIVHPLERVGIYVPGGTAAYPSSVLMNAIPASVAGVQEIIMAAPTRGDAYNPYVLLAAKIAGVSKVYRLGGAQAIAALAFGTETIPKVDKITGPGNLFVTLAKKAVYGHVDIDMLAGPSEICIVADDSANADYAAADMLSQAEHDVLASSILLTNSERLATAVANQLDDRMAKLPRAKIMQESLKRNGRIVLTSTLAEAIDFANHAAPEHLELLTQEPFRLLPQIHHAGAIFLGAYSPEPLGDYLAGPDHVLPTGGTARYASVLNVETFMRRTSLISYTPEALRSDAADIIRLAQAEGLQAHAEAIRERGK